MHSHARTDVACWIDGRARPGGPGLSDRGGEGPGFYYSGGASSPAAGERACSRDLSWLGLAWGRGGPGHRRRAAGAVRGPLSRQSGARSPLYDEAWSIDARGRGASLSCASMLGRAGSGAAGATPRTAADADELANRAN